jgi:tetratricopeptide (TPR) repeat protein
MKKQANILFIKSSSSGDGLGLRRALSRETYYQQLIGSLLTRSVNTKEGFETLGRQLANIAGNAYLSRQMDAVEQVSELMLALPTSNHLKSVAWYYHALSTKHNGDFKGARQILECMLESAPAQYKARALLSIGATYFDSGEVELSLPFYLAAGRAASQHDPVTLIESQQGLAIVRSIHGDHKQALAHLERIFPLVRSIAKHCPMLFYSFLNSLAVELGQMGRISEAEAAVGIALASPFAAAYPEISETRDEIAAKRQSATHSVVAVGAAPLPDTSSQFLPRRNRESRRPFRLIWLARLKSSIQISVTAAARKPIARFELIHRLLAKASNDSRPRAPPACP